MRGLPLGAGAAATKPSTPPHILPEAVGSGWEVVALSLAETWFVKKKKQLGPGGRDGGGGVLWHLLGPWLCQQGRKPTSLSLGSPQGAAASRCSSACKQDVKTIVPSLWWAWWSGACSVPESEEGLGVFDLLASGRRKPAGSNLPHLLSSQPCACSRACGSHSPGFLALQGIK